MVNVYELETEKLKILRLTRDDAWFSYIFGNRTGLADKYLEADVIIGPIANDTIYNTLGIFTSGFLKREETMKLLMIGPAYQQIVLKTEKAARNLTWISARVLTGEEIGRYRSAVAEEEAVYQRELAEKIEA